MSRATPDQRRKAVKRALSGESSRSIGDDIGVPAATVRSWVARSKAEDVFPEADRVVALVPAEDTARMTPIELLEHDIAATRRRLQLAEDKGVFTALAPLTSQVRKMQAELDALRHSQHTDAEDDDDEIRAFLFDHTRCKRWVRDILGDRQSRLAIEAVQAE